MFRNLPLFGNEAAHYATAIVSELFQHRVSDLNGRTSGQSKGFRKWSASACETYPSQAQSEAYALRSLRPHLACKHSRPFPLMARPKEIVPAKSIGNAVTAMAQSIRKPYQADQVQSVSVVGLSSKSTSRRGPIAGFLHLKLLLICLLQGLLGRRIQPFFVRPRASVHYPRTG